MTQKQKDAIKILNKVKDWTKNGVEIFSEEEYMTVLEAILDSNVTYYPYFPTPQPQPLEPYYQKEWITTCDTFKK